MNIDIKTRALEVLQITDTHLYQSTGGCLLGINTEQALQSAIDNVLSEGRKPDLVLATGDLVHDASRDGYRRIHEHFMRLNAPVCCLPGNHDERQAMRNFLQHEQVGWKDEVVLGNWLFVFLDSTIAGSDNSHLEDAELQHLETALRTHPDHHALVCLHHQPVPMDSRWLDVMAVDNADRFFEIIDRYAQVRGIAWGHVHQQFESMRNGVLLMSTPSTCAQFAPRTDTFAVDPVAPGYRWLRLHADGQIETEIVRLDEVPAGLDIASGGY